MAAEAFAFPPMACPISDSTVVTMDKGDHSMTAREIVGRVLTGEELTISSQQAFTFMRECERRDIECRVEMQINGDRCTISIGDITQARRRVPVYPETGSRCR